PVLPASAATTALANTEHDAAISNRNDVRFPFISIPPLSVKLERQNHPKVPWARRRLRLWLGCINRNATVGADRPATSFTRAVKRFRYPTFGIQSVASDRKISPRYAVCRKRVRS